MPLSIPTGFFYLENGKAQKKTNRCERSP